MAIWKVPSIQWFEKFHIESNRRTGKLRTSPRSETGVNVKGWKTVGNESVLASNLMTLWSKNEFVLACNHWGEDGRHWGKDGWLLKIYLFLGRNLMLEVQFHDMIWLNSVIRLQSYITKYIQQVELINETIQRLTRSELFLRLGIFTMFSATSSRFVLVR